MTKILNDEIITTPPRDAATVILLRDAEPALEVLLLRRGNSHTVMNNAWVFPGGKVDDTDFHHTEQITASLASAPDVLLAEPELSAAHACALFYAACRETQEETGVELNPKDLTPWSRWITPNVPSMMKKRFDARFFIARMPIGQTAVHDGEEATDSAWLTARGALEAYCANEITLAPPQIMTLAALARHPDTAACISYAETHTTYCIQPGVLKDNGNRTLIYPGDAEHPLNDQQMPGPTRLTWKGDHFEPVNGFEAFFED